MSPFILMSLPETQKIWDNNLSSRLIGFVEAKNKEKSKQKNEKESFLVVDALAASAVVDYSQRPSFNLLFGLVFKLFVLF